MNISPGTSIFRNYDHQFRQVLENSNTAQRTIEGKIKITINQRNIVITLTDEDKVETIIQKQNDFEPAKNTQVAEDSIRKQMAKTSNSAYTIANISIVCTENEIPYIPISVIIAWRRDLLDTRKIRLKVYPRYEKEISPNSIAYSEEEINFLSNVSNNLAKKFTKGTMSKPPNWLLNFCKTPLVLR